jgi:redox-regulated HSP33 family molecular chaperone
MLFPESPEQSEQQTTLVPGEGVMRVSRVLYSQSTPYMTSVHAQGTAQQDWATLFRQSEQIPTRVITHCDVTDSPLDKVLGVDAQGNVTRAMTPEEIVASQAPSAAAAAAAPATTASDHSAETTLDADKLAQDPLLYLHVPEDDAQFAGAVVIQVLAGAPDPVVAAEVLAARDQTKAKEAKGKHVKGSVTGVADPDADAEAEADTEADTEVDADADVEETDEQYVKRVQLERLQARAASLDMRGIMTQHGVAAYVACLLGETVESLGQRAAEGGVAEGNVNGEFDFEAMERYLIDSGIREKALKKAAEAAPAADVVQDVLSGVQGAVAAHQYKYHFQYRPVAFFCRCYQTKVEHKLAQMPVDLLQSLREDGGAAFTCDYCNAKQDVTVEHLEEAIHSKEAKESK